MLSDAVMPLKQVLVLRLIHRKGHSLDERDKGSLSLFVNLVFKKSINMFVYALKKHKQNA